MLPSHDTNHTAQPSSTSMQTACHPNHVNISTGGLLVHGNHCNNASKESSHPNKLHHPVRKQTNLAESDPTLFVQLLTERLEKVKESRGKVEKLMSLVNQVDEKHSVESGHSSVPLKDTKEYNRPLQLNNSTWCQQDATNSSINPSANEVNFTSAHIIHSSTTDDSKRLNYPHESAFYRNRRHTDKSQDAQEILDDHCSRIWADELGDSTINASKTHYRRQQSDCSRNTTSRSSTTPYPIISDTLVHSMHSSLVRGGSSGTEYEMKRLSEQYRTTTASYSSANSNNNISSNQPSMSDSSHRRWHTAGSYRGMNRLNKSDVRSTASWDSGVVTSYEMKSLNLNNNPDDNDYLDAETSSILEAASVQALSSSTTELALVNGEVTAKLVEKMIRHYPHKTFDRDSRHNGNMLPLFNSSQRKKETINPGYEYKYRLERKWQQQQQQSGHFYESPYVQGFNPNSSLCSACQHSADRVPCDWHHCFHYPSTHSTSNEHSSPHLMVTSCGCNQSSDKSMLGSSCRSFPTASDTSSTFDSGISSAYDQLPLQKHTNNRENRSQSLHNWQMNVNLKDTNLSTPRGNRTHSASKSSCDSNNTSRSINYPQTNCLIASCYEFNSSQLPGHYMQNDLCPTRHHHCPEMMMIKDVNKHDGNECKKPSSGKLLQHWLQLQQQHPSEKSHCPANDGQGKALSDNTIPGDHLRSHINKACKESHERKTHHHGHNHRKSSAQRTNSSPKYSLNNNNNMELSSCQHHSDDDDNKTNSVHMDSRLTSSTATNTQQQTSNVNSSGPGLVVGYYLCDDPVPYRTVWTGPTTAAHTNQTSSASSAVLVEVNDQSQTVDNCQTNSTGQPLLTLGQFKQLIAKKGVYRYFFKKPNDEFGTGVVHEELTNDDATLPLWEGKVVARVERAD
ncbi:unnamed protein product [Trichobilharzia szidati]|nr:unnamed protein product [Trichobilharzia szidati]